MQEFKLNRNESLLQDFSLSDNEEIVRYAFLNDFCLLGGNKRNQKIVTMNDVFSTRGLNDEEIVNLIKYKIGIDIRTKEGIEKLNNIFYKAVVFLHDILYKNTGNKINKNKKSFFSINVDKYGKLGNDVIEFLRITEKGRGISQTHCRIAKVVYGVNDILDNEEILKSEINAERLIKNNISNGIKIDNYSHLISYGKSQCSININNKIINFILKYRGKEDSSALLKLIYNPEYSRAELLNDPIGIELVCENEEEVILLLNYFYTVLFNENINEIKNKGFNINEIIKNKTLNDNFIYELSKSNGKRKTSTNKGYMDLKILGNIDGLLVEFRAVIGGNKESDILKSDEVYYLGKLILAIIRLDGYVTDNYIKLIINKFYIQNPEMNNKIDNNTLFTYLTNNLISINRGTKSRIYTSKDRYNTLNDSDFYPKNFKK